MHTSSSITPQHCPFLKYTQLIIIVTTVILAFGTPSSYATDGNDKNNTLDSRVIFESYRNKHPIFVPTCRSPQESLNNFFAITKSISQVFNEGSRSGNIDWAQEQELINLYPKAAYLLDISSLPKKEVFAKTNIICSQLSEILDRIPVPLLEQIPDKKEAELAGLEYWRIPDTEIALAKVKEGPRKGDWVFSADTVQRISKLYDRIKDFPYRKDAIVGTIKEDKGLLDHYVAYTGPLIPFSFTDRIPHWLRVEYWGDPLWKYFGTVGIMLFFGLLTYVIFRLTRFKKDHSENPNHLLLQLRRLLLPGVLITLIPVAVHFITLDIRLRQIPLEITNDILWTVFYLAAFWFILCLGNFVAAVIIHAPTITPFGVDAALVRLSCRIMSYFIGLWVVFEGVKELGLSLTPLLAGVGVGGLAFAFAIKPTLGSLIGGVMIFADKPFAVGHRVIVCGYEGYVEDIGIRSTRIRTLTGNLVTLPNDEVCNSHIENITHRPHIKRVLNIGLTYDTLPHKIQQAMDIVNDILSVEGEEDKTDEELQRPGNRHINSDEDNPVRVFFDELNSDSLNILVIYYFSPPNQWKYLEHATWVNSQLIERFNSAGIDFAFPTQTIEVKGIGDQE